MKKHEIGIKSAPCPHGINARGYTQGGRQKGFSLIEIAIVLVIIGLVTTGGLKMVKSQREKALYGASSDILKEMKTAVISFVVINGHMPCPDTDVPPDGFENRGTRQCSADSGVLPYADIGLGVSSVRDSWGNFIRYEVNRSATTLTNVNDTAHSASYFDGSSIPSALTFTLTTPPIMPPGPIGVGNLTINDGAGSSWAANQIAVLIAANSNGKQSFASCVSVDSKEQENCDGDADFIQDFRLLSGSAQIFDDTLLGISAGEIKSAILRERPGSL